MTEVINDLPTEFKQALGTEKIIFGMKNVIEALKSGKVEKVLYVSNIPENKLSDVEHFANLSNTTLQKFNGTNDDLGVLCKRAHSVLITALLKGKK